MSFTYTISSKDRTNDPGGLVNEFYIDFGGFGSYTGNYHCEVKRVTLNGHVKDALGYVLLTADNLHSDGYHSARPSSEMTLACIDSNTLLTTTHGSTCIVSNCSTKRRVKFTLTDSEYSPLSDAAGEIHIGGFETQWFMSLLLTPIG